MKKIVLLLLCLWVVVATINITEAAEVNETGHLAFHKLSAPSDTTFTLINQMSEKDKKKALSQIKRKIFGYSVYVLDVNKTVYFEGDTLFAKGNNTSKPLTFTYTYEVTETVETSVTASGSIAGKASGKYKGVSLGLDVAIRGEIGRKDKTVISENTRTSFTLDPGYKLSIIVKGEARLSNGASKYYFLGIVVKSGMWEYIDVVSEYYDFYEEKLY